MSTPAAAPLSAPTRSATTTPATFRTFAPPAAPPQEPSPAAALDAALPPPQIFDILPALHELLSRLLAPGSTPSAAPTANGDASSSAPQTQTHTLTQTDDHPNTQSQITGQPETAGTTTTAGGTAASQSQPTQTSTAAASQPHSQVNGAADAQTGQYTTLQPTYPNQAPLSIQHLAAEVSAIRNMIRRAREAVSGLPDVERSLEEQQEEIAYLTGEVGRLRGVLAGLEVREEAEMG